jgi:hypothetical protein
VNAANKDKTKQGREEWKIGKIKTAGKAKIKCF